MKSVSLREIVLFGVCIMLAFFLWKGCGNGVDTSKYIPKNLFDASQDSLHKLVNSLGQEQTKTRLLTGSVADLKKLSSSKDSSIQKLLKLVNNKTIGATILSNATSGTTSSSTISHAKDTIREKDSIIYVYPEYTLKRDSSKWEDISARANKDSFVVHYKIFNEFDIVQRMERQKVSGRWFKQDVSMVEVKNLNPKTQTRELKSFMLQSTKKHEGRTFLTGIGLGIITIIAIELKINSLK